jgi:hypothetical protein
MTPEEVEKILKDYGLNYKGTKHHTFENKSGRVYLKDDYRETLFFKEDFFSISRDSSVLFRGPVKKESDLRTLLRILEVDKV